MILSLVAAQEKLMTGRWNRKAAYFLAINFPAFHPAGGRKDKDEQADLKRSDGVVEYWSLQSSNAPLFHHSDSHRAMSINLLIGEGRGNRIMVGQNHCRNPFINCRAYSAGEPPCRDGRVALHDSVPR